MRQENPEINSQLHLGLYSNCLDLSSRSCTLFLSSSGHRWNIQCLGFPFCAFRAITVFLSKFVLPTHFLNRMFHCMEHHPLLCLPLSSYPFFKGHQCGRLWACRNDRSVWLIQFTCSVNIFSPMQQTGKDLSLMVGWLTLRAQMQTWIVSLRKGQSGTCWTALL